MEPVAFITTKTGDDLIVSFAIRKADDLSGVESLTFIRTPKHERMVVEADRGVWASFDRYGGEDELLEAVEYDESRRVVRVRTARHRYELDLGKVEASDVRQMREVFREMNFDGKLELLGV